MKNVNKTERAVRGHAARGRRVPWHLAGALGILGIPAMFAMDWPSAEAVMTANFGGNDKGLPHVEITFVGEGPVRAAGEGEVIFVNTPRSTASRIPSPMGAWVAIDHGDGLISIYSHLADPQAIPVPDHPEQGRVIAASGRSGWSNREGFSFGLFDRKERRWINPSMIITPFADTIRPVIHSVELFSADGRVFNPASTKNLPQGRYTLSVYATDTRLNEESPLAPYRIIASVNGQERGDLPFETYSARDGVLMVARNGMVPVRQVYARHPAFEVGDLWFTRGRAVLEIIVQDILGNSRNVTFNLRID
ncbi:MAG: M23 family metallopeptidase [Treponema sp.]|jgi:murein DD-endopeptidase MepM/ murein hydrolase activator NlpD|nr:M23 family metallopeptidase [Treponema sp.]